jgi:hypothetical protein
MGEAVIKQEIELELEETRRRFIALVEAIPEEEYALPTDNPAWAVGDILFHMTLGPRALAFEIWMLVHARGLFQFTMEHFPSRLFNGVNAWFGRQNRVSRQGLLKAYEAGHAVIRSRLRRTREEDFSKSVVYPASFVAEIAGEVTVERLFRYVKGHFEVHEAALRVRRN